MTYYNPDYCPFLELNQEDIAQAIPEDRADEENSQVHFLNSRYRQIALGYLHLKNRRSNISDIYRHPNFIQKIMNLYIETTHAFKNGHQGNGILMNMISSLEKMLEIQNIV